MYVMLYIFWGGGGRERKMQRDLSMKTTTIQIPKHLYRYILHLNTASSISI